MKHIYYNRYGSISYFEEKSKNEIIFKVPDISYLRCSYEKDNLTMIDPDGGPFITIGSNLGEFVEKLQGFIVDKIEDVGENCFKITFHK